MKSVSRRSRHARIQSVTSVLVLTLRWNCFVVRTRMVHKHGVKNCSSLGGLTTHFTWESESTLIRRA